MHSDAMTIRAATSADTDDLGRPAGSTSRPRPRGPLLVAEHDGDMLAAIAVSSGAVITDPGRAAADVVRDLRRRRDQLLRQNGGVGEARTLVHRLTATTLAA